MYTCLCLLTSFPSVKRLFAHKSFFFFFFFFCRHRNVVWGGGVCVCPFFPFFASNNTCVRGCVYVCACVYLASRQKQLRLSSCRVPQEPRSFPAQHITLQNYRGRSWWKMRLILDRNYCSNPQAPTPACFFFFSLLLCMLLSIYCISQSIFYISLAAPLLHLSSFILNAGKFLL